MKPLLEIYVSQHLPYNKTMSWTLKLKGARRGGASQLLNSSLCMLFIPCRKLLDVKGIHHLYLLAILITMHFVAGTGTLAFYEEKKPSP